MLFLGHGGRMLYLIPTQEQRTILVAKNKSTCMIIKQINLWQRPKYATQLSLRERACCRKTVSCQLLHLWGLLRPSP